MTSEHDVLIVGAGLSGIGTACQIQREFRDKRIAILERRKSLGGTWDLFRYPGIRSDSDMFSFGYGFRPWNETQVLADGPSIRRYIADTAAEFGVDRKIHYGVKILSADWSSEEKRWTLRAIEEETGEEREYQCRFLVSCTGYYDHDAGYLPEFPGAERFRGRRIHPQHWPEDLDYAGKQVVVVGSGATAVTLVPAMADTAAHVTMLQRSPSYVFSVPALDRISERLGRVLPARRVYAMARKRNIWLQRFVYRACRRFPTLMRRLLLSQVRKHVGADFDMSHFTPKYMPWDERLCAVPDADLFAALRSGRASIVTDEIETFTESGIRLKSGKELAADVIVTATGLNLKMLGGIELRVDGRPRPFHERMAYKSVLVQDVPNLAFVFGYTNASWTLKSDLAGAYLCRLLRHMDAHGLEVATPHDADACSTGASMLESLRSGYVQRGKAAMPRQGRKLPWKVLMDYRHDRRALLHDPIDDGVLRFDTPPAAVAEPAPSLRTALA